MIKCNIDFNLKNASIYIDNCFLETKSFSDLTFKKETNIDFKNCNDLYLINKVSIYLKLKYNAKEVDTVFIINNKYIYELLKPNGILIKKLTKSIKKNILNNELKLILGSTLFEINSMQNVDLILQEENKKGDKEMINNKLNETFDLNENSSEFDLDSDFDFEIDTTISEFDLNNNIDLSPLDSIINNDNLKLDDDLNLNKKNDKHSIEISELEDISSNETNFIKEDDIKYRENNNFDLKEQNILEGNTNISLINNSDNNLTKNITIDIRTTKQEDLKNELLHEFKNMEKYIDEQIDFLEKQSKELENENSKLKLNINDLNIDEETIIESFNKSMEIRLRLKVIKKSCRIYNNMKLQLITELSKF